MTPAGSAEGDLPPSPLASTPSSVLRTSGWRTLRPVLRTDACTRCNVCWKFCPDTAIGLDTAGYPVIRLEFCKGCGICAHECVPGALEMVPEEV